MMSRPTIADVAKRAGVSTGTVSNVLANPRVVRLETRRRVEAAVAELDYRPNRVAQSLSRQRTHIVGMVVPDVANPFFSEVLLGVESELEGVGYAVVFGNSQDSVTRQFRYLTSFQERQVDGLVVVVAPDTDGRALSEIATRIPLVLVDRTLREWSGDQVLGDNEAGMELAVDHLVQLGHRKVALINGEPRLSTAQRRQRGFETSLRLRKLEPHSLSDGSFTMESGFAQASRIFESANRPTAICAGNDLLAIAAANAATESGLEVPKDVSIVGYDDIAYARLVSPSLTTIRQPGPAMGAAAARLLLERLDGQRKEERTIVLKPELIVRRSTSAVRR